jgi:hypothetical protein
MPQFQVRGLLTLIAIVAVILTALCRPSVHWVIGLPIAATILSVAGAIRVALLPQKRTFWIAILAGLTVYGITLTGIWTLLWLMHYPGWRPNTIGYFYTVERPFWSALHGEIPQANSVTSQGYQLMDFVSFSIALHVALALLISAIVAFVAQYMMRRPITSDNSKWKPNSNN